MRIGIYGGSFNPIHRGHIALAKQILRKARLDEVWFLVTPLNPFKAASNDLLADDLRLMLTRKALEQEERLVASDYEFRLPKPSYTWDTLQALSHDYPEHEFVLVVGADNWIAFDRWHRSSDILAHYRIVVYPRENCAVDPAQMPNGVSLVRPRLYNVSSTDVRRRVAEGRGIKRMVPAAIADDVVRLYGQK